LGEWIWEDRFEGILVDWVGMKGLFGLTNLSGLGGDERVVWINGCMVRFEGIWGDSLWKFGNDLIHVIDLFLFF